MRGHRPQPVDNPRRDFGQLGEVHTDEVHRKAVPIPTPAEALAVFVEDPGLDREERFEPVPDLGDRRTFVLER
jgi:hypothetical protein